MNGYVQNYSEISVIISQKRDLITLFLHFSDVYLDSPHFVLHGNKEYLTLHFKQI